MTDIESFYHGHLRILRDSDVPEHRINALEIAKAALIRRRKTHSKHPRKTEPYKSRWEATLAEYDRLIAQIS